MTTGLAFRMRLELAKLAAHHGSITPSPCALPLYTAATDEPLCIEGIAASVGTIDTTRMMFAPRAFLLPAIPSRMPKLLYRHDSEQVAGSISELFHDADGNLCLHARVTHELARRAPALSVAVDVLAYEIKNADSPNFFALITRAAVPTEISLTPSPANVHALVTARYPEPAALKFYDLMAARVKVLIKQLEIIQQVAEYHARTSAVAPKSPARTAPRGTQRSPMIAPPQRPTQFSALAAALNERTS